MNEAKLQHCLNIICSEKVKLSAAVTLAFVALFPPAFFLIATPGPNGKLIAAICTVVAPFAIYSPFLAIGFVVVTLIVGVWCIRSRSRRAAITLFICITASALYIVTAYRIIKFIEGVGSLQGGGG
jgi:hypothetical protein